MQVDRAGFLFFSGVIASGCGGQTEPAPAPVLIATADPDVVNDGLPESYPLVSEPAPHPGGTPNPGLSPADESLPPPQFEGIATAEDGSCRAKNVARPPASGCNDNVGQPGNCSAVKLAGGCPSFQFICDHCEGYKTFFKPRVAERAIKCVVAQQSAELQDGCRTYACGDEALKSACLDPTADGPCNSIASRCKTTMEECKSLLSGMNNAGRAQVTACAAAGCQFGIWSCIEGM